MNKARSGNERPDGIWGVALYDGILSHAGNAAPARLGALDSEGWLAAMIEFLTDFVPVAIVSAFIIWGCWMLVKNHCNTP
jgi:hypothetical protein